MWGVYFDGKKDPTRHNLKNNETGYYHPRRIPTKHITLIKEPNGYFLTHIAVKNSDAETIAAAMYNTLKDHPVMGGDQLDLLKVSVNKFKINVLFINIKHSKSN